MTKPTNLLISMSRVCKLFSWLVLCVFYLGMLGQANAESGIVTWKEQSFHSDELANAFEFDRMKASPQITWFYKGGKQKSFEKHEKFNYLIYPPGLAVELAEPQQYQDLKRHYTELADFVKRFPKSAEFIKPRLEAYKPMLENYENGKVLFTGKWMPRAEYTVLVRERDKQLEEKRIQRETARTEEMERQQAEILERNQKASRAVAVKFAQKVGLGAVIYLMVLILAISRKSLKLLALVLLFPILFAGYLTYKERGYQWFHDAKAKLSLALKKS